MTALALVISGLLLLVAALARMGAASMLRGNRADALHDAAEGRAGAATIAELLEDREAVVPGVNIVHSILLVTAALPAAWSVQILMEGAALLPSLVLLGLILIVGGDLLPRRIGRARPGSLAYRLAFLLRAVIAIGGKASDLVRTGNGEDEHEEDEEEMDDSGEIELITSVLEFSETIVREVMVPRPDMVIIEAGASIGELLALIDSHGFSRVPVVGEGGIDDVVGLVIAKDLLPRLTSSSPPRRVADVIRPIDFVPETKRVSELLKEMQASKAHMAVVVDEYGGTAGLVTIEDLLEELVGEIVDEYDEDELLIEEQADGSWLVDGRLSVSELAGIVGSELPDEEWDTVGGLVLGLAGRVPHEGEEFEVGEVRLRVVRLQGRRIAEVSVQRREMEPALEETG